MHNRLFNYFIQPTTPIFGAKNVRGIECELERLKYDAGHEQALGLHPPENQTLHIPSVRT